MRSIVMDPDDFELAMNQIAYVEERLRLPKGFVGGLLNETDWGFVIKLHAVFESLLNVSISHALLSAHSTGLEQIVTRLGMAGRSGKIAVAAQLELIDDYARRFLETLAELRNALVHSVQGLGFDFTAWIALMDEKKQGIYASRFEASEELLVPQGDFLNHPKQYVFYGAINIMHGIDVRTPEVWQQALRREATIDINEILSALDLTDKADSEE